MPKTISMGLVLAMLGHGLWNGSSWTVAYLLAESESFLSAILQLAWLLVMIVALWVCILRCLPTIVLGAKD